MKNNKDLKGYVPPFQNMSTCDFEGTGLCTLKDEKCIAEINCNKEEIEDGNEHNGISDPSMYIDRAIKDDKERYNRNLIIKNKLGLVLMVIVMIIGDVLVCWCFCKYVRAIFRPTIRVHDLHDGIVREFKSKREARDFGYDV